MLAWCKHALCSLLSPTCSQTLFPLPWGSQMLSEHVWMETPGRDTGYLSSWVLAAAVMVTLCLLALG